VGGDGTRRTGRTWAELKGNDSKLHELARHLRGLVDRSGHTLRTVSDRCGCSRTTVSKRLSGAELPSWEFVASLVNACVADPTVQEKRRGQFRDLWQRATEAPSRSRRQHHATDLVPDPRTMVIAAQKAAIDAQQQLLDLHDRLHDAHQQLLDSQRAERSTAQMVWVLYWALGRAFQLVGELTRTRDTARLANNQGGLKPAARQLNAAQVTRARTQSQLERAQSEHQRAIALAEAAAQKVAMLQTMLTGSGSTGPHGVQSPEAVAEDRMGIDDLADLNGGLDHMEHLLDAQDGELTRLDQEINGRSTTKTIFPDDKSPTLMIDPQSLPTQTSDLSTPRGKSVSSTSGSEPPNKDAARLQEIAINSDISMTHRLKACSNLATLGPNHLTDTATALRSIILDNSIIAGDRAKALEMLGRLGDLYRREASTMLQKFLSDGNVDTSSRISFLRWYEGIGDSEQRAACEYLQEISFDESVDPLDRVHAARTWRNIQPNVAPQIAALLKEIESREDITEVTKNAAHKIVHEIETNPW
jgi:hypothetical protein